jgi:hypothetical protein
MSSSCLKSLRAQYQEIGLVSSLGRWYAHDGDNYHKMQMGRARVGEIGGNIEAEVCFEAKVPKTVRQRKPMTSMPDDEISLVS